jgi:hypothetical protein
MGDGRGDSKLPTTADCSRTRPTDPEMMRAPPTGGRANGLAAGISSETFP